MPKKRKNPESDEESEQSQSVEKPAKKTKKIQKKKQDKSSAKKKNESTKEQTAKPKQRKQVQGKQDFLPGQKYAYPPQQDGAAQFYRTLYSQNPKSQIARKYVIEYGLLQQAEAEKLCKQIAKKK